LDKIDGYQRSRISRSAGIDVMGDVHSNTIEDCEAL
jgi:hypothetical protein